MAQGGVATLWNRTTIPHRCALPGTPASALHPVQLRIPGLSILESGACMRISVQQRRDVCTELRRRFGEQCRIWLFGSRADDKQRGGDVDLYVEAVVQPGGGRAMTRIRANAALEKFFDGACVDLMVRFPGESEQPLHRIAKRRGSLLQ